MPLHRRETVRTELEEDICASVASDTPTAKYRLCEQMRNRTLYTDENLYQGVSEVPPVVLPQVVMASSLKTPMFVPCLGLSNARVRAQAGVDGTAGPNLHAHPPAARAAAPSDGASARVILGAAS